MCIMCIRYYLNQCTDSIAFIRVAAARARQQERNTDIERKRNKKKAGKKEQLALRRLARKGRPWRAQQPTHSTYNQ